MNGLVRFFIRHHVPSNLLTVSIIAGGIFAAFHIRREFFPDIAPDSARILLLYPGASPQEVEESLVRRVEDLAVEVDGVDRLETTVSEGGGGIVVKFEGGVNVRRRVEDLRDRLESLTDLPADAERIRVTEFEPNLPVIQVTVYGDSDNQTLKSSIRQVADDLKTFSGMGQVVISGTRDDELRIEVNHEDLLRHEIPITRVADVVSAWMRKIPGGSVRNADGEVKVRTLGVEERADRIREIVVKAYPDGGLVHVGDIAKVEEGFTDAEVVRKFNGEPSANCTVFRKGQQDAVDMAQFTRGYVAARRSEPLNPSIWERLFGSKRMDGWKLGASRSPLQVSIQKHNDLAKLIEDRLDLLTRNALQGGMLVFITLLLGVHWRAACFVTLGIIVAIFGTLLVMDLTGISLNLLTMFALLMTLGMLADDAIVLSESIEIEASGGGDVERNVLDGVSKVLWPVVASSVTTIVAFIPLVLVQGRIGDILGELPIVVSLALLISLLEAILLLPGHMAVGIVRERAGKTGMIDRLMRPIDRWREHWLWPSIERCYRRTAFWCIDRRYLTVSAGISAFIISVALVVGGRLPFTFLPSNDSETAIVEIRLPLGASMDLTKVVGARVEKAARAQPDVRAITSIYGLRVNYETAIADSSSSNLAQIFVELSPVEERSRRSADVMDSILKAAGPLDEAESVSVQEISGGPAGADITYQISGDDIEEVRDVSAQIKKLIAQVHGVLSVADDDFDAQPEVQILPRPGAAALGFTPADIARQVRGALYGLDAHVFSDNREDVDVRVRLDDRMRSHGDFADHLWVVPPSGIAVPLGEIAEIRERTSASTINRLDRMRTITVTGDTQADTYPEAVVEQMSGDIAKLIAAHPSVRLREGGRQRDLTEAFATLPLAIAAAFLMIYAILAWLFGNYTQPLAVMISIPFGVIGMVGGHLLLGSDLTFLSVIGLVALAGVVVNNALVLVEFVNIEVAAGRPLREGLVLAGEKRIRAILLTSVTTILGLAPLVLEPSFQARFVAPMAITLSGGLVSATALTLILLPSVIYIIDDVKKIAGRIWNGSQPIDGADPASPR